jgi:hypothetical protein
MMLQKGQRYRCQNPECGAEIEVIKESIEGASGVRCCCGELMKRRYSKPLMKIRPEDTSKSASGAAGGHG